MKKLGLIFGTALLLPLFTQAQGQAPNSEVPNAMTADGWTELLQKTDTSADNASVSAAIRDLAYRVATVASGQPDPATNAQKSTAFDAWNAQFPKLTDPAIRASQGNTAANQWARLTAQVEAQSKPKLTHTQQVEAMIVSTILFWYSTEIRTEFVNAQDKALWQQDRVKADKLFRYFAGEYPEAMRKSWVALGESCRLLGLPQGQLP